MVFWLVSSWKTRYISPAPWDSQYSDSDVVLQQPVGEAQNDVCLLKLLIKELWVLWFLFAWIAISITDCTC